MWGSAGTRLLSRSIVKMLGRELNLHLRYLHQQEITLIRKILSLEISSCQLLHKRSIDLCYTKCRLWARSIYITQELKLKIQTLMPHSNLLNHFNKIPVICMHSCCCIKNFLLLSSNFRVRAEIQTHELSVSQCPLTWTSWLNISCGAWDWEPQAHPWAVKKGPRDLCCR